MGWSVTLLTNKVYRALSFKASLLLLVSNPLNLLDKTLNNSGSRLGGASRSRHAPYIII